MQFQMLSRRGKPRGLRDAAACRRAEAPSDDTIQHLVERRVPWLCHSAPCVGLRRGVVPDDGVRATHARQCVQVRQPAPQVALARSCGASRRISPSGICCGDRSRQANAPVDGRRLHRAQRWTRPDTARATTSKAPTDASGTSRSARRCSRRSCCRAFSGRWATTSRRPTTSPAGSWPGRGTSEGEPARFRLQSDHETDGEWAWLENPFAGTRPLQGLVAINLLLNNLGLQDQQQPGVSLTRCQGASHSVDTSSRISGASLGKPRGLPDFRGTRNDIDDFEDTQSDQEGQRLEGSTRLSRPARRHPRATEPGRRDLGLRADESADATRNSTTPSRPAATSPTIRTALHREDPQPRFGKVSRFARACRRRPRSQE